MNDTTLTVVQKLLVTALRLEQPDCRTQFSAEVLTVAAWKAYPETFGMKGFKEYPCTNSTFTNLMGERSLPARGWLVKVGPKLYELSEQGRAEAVRLANGGGRQSLARIEPSRDCEHELQRLLGTRAMLRLRANMGQTLNWTDAADFWANTNSDGVERLVTASLNLLVRNVVRLRSGREVSRGELDELGRVNAWLEKRFRREVEKRKSQSQESKRCV